MDTGYVCINEHIIRAFLTPRIATIYEVILFGFALYKYMMLPDLSHLPALKRVTVLTRALINDNILYFFGYGFVFSLEFHDVKKKKIRVTIVLLLNNLEVSVSKSFGWR